MRIFNKQLVTVKDKTDNILSTENRVVVDGVSFIVPEIFLDSDKKEVVYITERCVSNNIDLITVEEWEFYKNSEWVAVTEIKEEQVVLSPEEARIKWAHENGIDLESLPPISEPS